MRAALGFAAALACAAPALASDFKLSLPVDCTLGETCFLQQMVDLDPSEGVIDPICGSAAYDGHTGTDFRVPQLLDTGSAGGVVAAADGVVVGVREGEPDRLVESAADRAAVGDRGCGNGVVVDHADGWQTQYCHLARGSVTVQAGQQVQAGDPLGAIGLSGTTQFPHLEFLVRRDGQIVDPFTGLRAGDACSADALANTLWRDVEAIEAAGQTTRLIGAGFSSAPVEHDTLMLADPVGLYAGAEALVGWAWAINVAPGDVFRVTLRGPQGLSFAHEGDPLERRQASYAMFAGQRVAVVPGTYAGTVELVRNGAVIDARAIAQTVE
ncbi:MAG: M23 family metallopeptidase [Devosiaceae bacterium]|nr:M23 family metallopeptidase [Devosiaceae bacterium MH13]